MLPGYSVVFVLVLLLVGTTPIGTGAGVHQFDLVHPLFEHVHLVNGRVLTHEEFSQAASPRTTDARYGHASPEGPAVGAGSGAEVVDGGVGWSPTPVGQLARLAAGPLWTWLTLDLRLPEGRAEAPPDPPPTPAG